MLLQFLHDARPCRPSIPTLHFRSNEDTQAANSVPHPVRRLALRAISVWVYSEVLLSCLIRHDIVSYTNLKYSVAKRKIKIAPRLLSRNLGRQRCKWTSEKGQAGRHQKAPPVGQQGASSAGEARASSTRWRKMLRLTRVFLCRGGGGAKMRRVLMTTATRWRIGTFVTLPMKTQMKTRWTFRSRCVCLLRKTRRRCR